MLARSFQLPIVKCELRYISVLVLYGYVVTRGMFRQLRNESGALCA